MSEIPKSIKMKIIRLNNHIASANQLMSQIEEWAENKNPNVDLDSDEWRDNVIDEFSGIRGTVSMVELQKYLEKLQDENEE